MMNHHKMYFGLHVVRMSAQLDLGSGFSSVVFIGGCWALFRAGRGSEVLNDNCALGLCVTSWCHFVLFSNVSTHLEKQIINNSFKFLMNIILVTAAKDWILGSKETPRL